MTTDSPQTAADSQAGPVAVERKPVILAVDDNKLLLKTYQHIFESDGELRCFRLEGFTGVQPAIQWMSRDSINDKPAAILLDWVMDGMDGMGFLRFLKQDPRWTDIPVIMATSNRGHGNVMQASAEGVRDYIIKPVETKILIQKLRRLLPDLMAKAGGKKD